MILCANCHAMEHDRLVANKDRPYGTKAVKVLMLEYMKASGCETCGFNDSVVALDFHHRDPAEKEFSPMGSISGKHTRLSDRTRKELDKCKVLCKNCHIGEHTDLKFLIDNKTAIEDKQHKLIEVNNKIDEAIIDELCSQGLTVTEISKKLSLNKSTVGTITRRIGYGKPQDEIKTDPTEILRLQAEGKSATEISKILHVGKSTIYNALSDAGLTPNKMIDPFKGKRKLEFSREEAEEMLKTMSYADIGRLYGVTWEAARNRIKRLGIPVKSKKN